jgi:hypothetical protein
MLHASLAFTHDRSESLHQQGAEKVIVRRTSIWGGDLNRRTRTERPRHDSKGGPSAPCQASTPAAAGIFRNRCSNSSLVGSQGRTSCCREAAETRTRANLRRSVGLANVEEAAEMPPLHFVHLRGRTAVPGPTRRERAWAAQPARSRCNRSSPARSRRRSRYPR